MPTGSASTCNCLSLLQPPMYSFVWALVSTPEVDWLYSASCFLMGGFKYTLFSCSGFPSSWTRFTISYCFRFHFYRKCLPLLLLVPLVSESQMLSLIPGVTIIPTRHLNLIPCWSRSSTSVILMVQDLQIHPLTFPGSAVFPKLWTAHLHLCFFHSTTTVTQNVLLGFVVHSYSSQWSICWFPHRWAMIQLHTKAGIILFQPATSMMTAVPYHLELLWVLHSYFPQLEGLCIHLLLSQIASTFVAQVFCLHFSFSPILLF